MGGSPILVRALARDGQPLLAMSGLPISSRVNPLQLHCSDAQVSMPTKTLQNSFQQPSHRYIELVGDFCESGDREIDLATFNVAHVNTVYVAKIGERLLRNPLFVAKFPDFFA